MTTDFASAFDVHFGTDGWRAVIGESFNLPTLARVAEATARAYRSLLDDPENELDMVGPSPNTLFVGYDCRLDAHAYAAFFAEIVAAHGFNVLVSDRFCPTPALCWTVAHKPDAVGGVMLTASHNPAEYLGVKLRMSDGGASPDWFSKIVESFIDEKLPDNYQQAAELFQTVQRTDPDLKAKAISGAIFDYADLMDEYLANLANSVDRELIRQARLSVVVDPMYGSGRGYLAKLLSGMGVTVYEIHGEKDPGFADLHPEPILPWVLEGAKKVAELSYAACLINDGDADRIGAVDGNGVYVTSHRIISLVIAHLVEGRGMTGRVVRTSAGSNLIKRQCQRLGLELTTKPIGFKWVYEEMLKGDVLIGGEESGGFGVPTHVRERDGLLMALLLVEMMAARGNDLSGLVEELLGQVGTLEFKRIDLTLTEAEQAGFLNTHVHASNDASFYAPLFSGLGEELVDIDRTDGIMFHFGSDAWLLARPSGTEPLVRVYAEAPTDERVAELLAIGCDLAKGLIAGG
ncbi:MAG: phosphoglucosamine mutase [Coriobacteriia bacterium]|nr:phosphoglucosamine mutase [Coriobacteriia bacterium]